MMQGLVPSELGQNILIVIDNCPACLNMLRKVVSQVPQVTHRSFTLLDCCPTIYWEHGAGPEKEVKPEIIVHSQTEDMQFKLTKRYLEEARSVLLNAGIPITQIRIMTAIEEDTYIGATLAELKRDNYSDVIVSRQHPDIVERLRGHGLTDRFRNIPKVAVWAIDMDAEAVELTTQL